MSKTQRSVDPRQQTFDFDALLPEEGAGSPVAARSEAKVEARQARVTQSLRLLGAVGSADEAAIDAARMRAHVLCTMAERALGKPTDARLHAALSVLMLTVTETLKEGSLCVGRAQFEEQKALYDEAMARRAFEERSGSEVLGQVDFDEVVELLCSAGFAARAGDDNPSVFAGGPALFKVERDGDETLVYTQKSWAQEEALGKRLAELAIDTVPQPAASPETEAERAGRLALANRLTVISGGPGTGKTTAVVQILRGLLEQNPQAKILLAAPTGKAAGRMKEAVANGASKIDDLFVRSSLERLQAKTLHRTLYTPAPDGRTPSKKNPLEADVLVVDESSMIDIGLTGDLFERIDASRTKVILLGDRFQLAAVGPGSFFADVSRLDGPLADNISHLTKSWRFTSDKALGILAEAAREGNEKCVLETLASGAVNRADENNPMRLHEQVPEGALSEAFRTWLKRELAAPLRYIDELLNAREMGLVRERTQAAQALAHLYFSIGVLAANREGVMSTQAVNAFAESLLAGRGIPYPAFRPMIVRRNDPMLEVYNGDTGVVMPSEAWFEGAPFEATGADVFFADAQRFVRFGLIGHIEPAFAITIHQSQGSEYHHVAVLMPQNEASGLASRELFYTAVTRVRDVQGTDEVEYGSLDVFSSAEVLKKAVATPVHRQGGLARRIAQAKEKLADKTHNRERKEK